MLEKCKESLDIKHSSSEMVKDQRRQNRAWRQDSGCSFDSGGSDMEGGDSDLEERRNLQVKQKRQQHRGTSLDQHGGQAGLKPQFGGSLPAVQYQRTTVEFSKYKSKKKNRTQRVEGCLGQDFAKQNRRYAVYKQNTINENDVTQKEKPKMDTKQPSFVAKDFKNAQIKAEKGGEKDVGKFKKECDMKQNMPSDSRKTEDVEEEIWKSNQNQESCKQKWKRKVDHDFENVKIRKELDGEKVKTPFEGEKRQALEMEYLQRYKIETGQEKAVDTGPRSEMTQDECIEARNKNERTESEADDEKSMDLQELLDSDMEDDNAKLVVNLPTELEQLIDNRVCSDETNLKVALDPLRENLTEKQDLEKDSGTQQTGDTSFSTDKSVPCKGRESVFGSQEIQGWSLSCTVDDNESSLSLGPTLPFEVYVKSELSVRQSTEVEEHSYTFPSDSTLSSEFSKADRALKQLESDQGRQQSVLHCLREGTLECLLDNKFQEEWSERCHMRNAPAELLGFLKDHIARQCVVEKEMAEYDKGSFKYIKDTVEQEETGSWVTDTEDKTDRCQDKADAGNIPDSCADGDSSVQDEVGVCDNDEESDFIETEEDIVDSEEKDFQEKEPQVKDSCNTMECWEDPYLLKKALAGDVIAEIRTVIKDVTVDVKDSVEIDESEGQLREAEAVEKSAVIVESRKAKLGHRGRKSKKSYLMQLMELHLHVKEAGLRISNLTADSLFGWQTVEHLCLEFGEEDSCPAVRSGRYPWRKQGYVRPRAGGSGRGWKMFRNQNFGRQCSQKGSGSSAGGGRHMNEGGSGSGKKSGDGEKPDKNEKNQQNKDRNNEDYNNNNSDKDSGRENPSGKTTEQATAPQREITSTRTPEPDFKGPRKKVETDDRGSKHTSIDDYAWLDKIGEAISEDGGPSTRVFEMLDPSACTCVSECLAQPEQLSAEGFLCSVCLTVDSLLRHFANCAATYNSCDMCVKIFSLVCSHVSECMTGPLTAECGVNLCKIIVNMLEGDEICTHLRTLWFQVRKKLARIIAFEIEENEMIPFSQPQEKPAQASSRSRTHRGSVSGTGSGPLPSIPEGAPLSTSSSSRSGSRVLVRKKSGLTNVEEGYTAETTSEAVGGEHTDDTEEEQTDSKHALASGVVRPETESDALPNFPEEEVESSELGSNDSSETFSNPHVQRRIISLPIGPMGPSEPYYPSFKDKPTGMKGIGEVVYDTKQQMVKVVKVWEQFKEQYRIEAKLAKHYREEGVILIEFKSKLKINKLRYNRDFQWVKLAHLGNGMTGKCMLASDFETNFKFCVKELHIANYEKEEIVLWSDLEHRNIVQIYGAIRHGEKIYILQELIEGGSLTEAINVQRKLGRRLSQLTALRFFKELLQVLKYLKSKSILHEDLKADNILLNNTTAGVSIKVTDFGLARRCPASVRQGTPPVGTQTQWSPEKAKAEGYSYAAEVWAAICVFVHMLSGLPPWVRRFETFKALIVVIVEKSPPMEDVPRNIQQPLRELIEFGFTVNPTDRPTAEQLLLHHAFRLLEKAHSMPVYSVLESVHLESTNHISDDPNADLREIFRNLEKEEKTGVGAKQQLDFADVSTKVAPDFHQQSNDFYIYTALQGGGDPGEGQDSSAASGASGGGSGNQHRDRDMEILQQQISHHGRLRLPSQPDQNVDPSGHFERFISDEGHVVSRANQPNLTEYFPSDTSEKQNTVSVESFSSSSVARNLIPDFGQLDVSSDSENKSGPHMPNIIDDYPDFGNDNEVSGMDQKEDLDVEEALRHVNEKYLPTVLSPSLSTGSRSSATRIEGSRTGGEEFSAAKKQTSAGIEEIPPDPHQIQAGPSGLSPYSIAVVHTTDNEMKIQASQSSPSLLQQGQSLNTAQKENQSRTLNQYDPRTPNQSGPRTPNQSSPRTPKQSGSRTPNQSGSRTPNQSSPKTPNQMKSLFSPENDDDDNFRSFTDGDELFMSGDETADGGLPLLNTGSHTPQVSDGQLYNQPPAGPANFNPRHQQAMTSQNYAGTTYTAGNYTVLPNLAHQSGAIRASTPSTADNHCQGQQQLSNLAYRGQSLSGNEQQRFARDQRDHPIPAYEGYSLPPASRISPQYPPGDIQHGPLQLTVGYTQPPNQSPLYGNPDHRNSVTDRPVGMNPERPVPRHFISPPYDSAYQHEHRIQELQRQQQQQHPRQGGSGSQGMDFISAFNTVPGQGFDRVMQSHQIGSSYNPRYQDAVLAHDPGRVQDFTQIAPAVQQQQAIQQHYSMQQGVTSMPTQSRNQLGPIHGDLGNPGLQHLQGLAPMRHQEQGLVDDRSEYYGERNQRLYPHQGMMSMPSPPAQIIRTSSTEPGSMTSYSPHFKPGMTSPQHNVQQSNPPAQNLRTSATEPGSLTSCLPHFKPGMTSTPQHSMQQNSVRPKTSPSTCKNVPVQSAKYGGLTMIQPPVTTNAIRDPRQVFLPTTGVRIPSFRTQYPPQPKTPILNPSINPRPPEPKDGQRMDLWLDIGKAQHGSGGTPVSAVQTAPVISPPKKSPDLQRTMSQLPPSVRKSPSLTEGMFSPPNQDRMSTSTSRSQFEEQDEAFRELGRTAEDALSQHSDHIVFTDIYSDDQPIKGELEDIDVENPAQSLAHMLDSTEEDSIYITFRSAVNQNQFRLRLGASSCRKTWEKVIREDVDGFSRLNMQEEFGVCRFCLKGEAGYMIDLESPLGGAKKQLVWMVEAADTDPWWIEGGMISR